MVYQLFYACRLKIITEELLEELRTILNDAHDIFYRNNIMGVLYYADGQFFHCLEGDKEFLDACLDYFEKDQALPDSNKEYRIFSLHASGEQRNYKNWKMKYVKKHTRIDRFFKKNEFVCFKPYDLTEQQFEKLKEIVLQDN